jgi:hypothetical protein
VVGGEEGSGGGDHGVRRGGGAARVEETLGHGRGGNAAGSPGGRTVAWTVRCGGSGVGGYWRNGSPCLCIYRETCADEGCGLDGKSGTGAMGSVELGHWVGNGRMEVIGDIDGTFGVLQPS